MTLNLLLLVGVPIALLGLVLQVAYLILSSRDLQFVRHDPDLTREQQRRGGWFSLARLVSSVTLGVVHLVVVLSVAAIVHAGIPAAAESPVAWELAYGRIAVSTLVILSTAVNLLARWAAWAR